MSSHHHACQHQSAQPSVCQSLQEMEFERGIWTAALEGDVSRVEHLLQKDNVDIRDASGYTALHYAARAGHINVCKLLIRRGADINACTRAGQATPLQRAAANGKLDICKLLMENGADITVTDSDGKTALERARDNKHANVTHYLEQMGTKIA